MASPLSGGALLPLLLTGSVVATVLVALLWMRRSRAYLSPASVAAAYDRWTDDRLLERLWGDHVHLGHYGDPPEPRDFRAAKAAFVHELVRWSGLDRLPPGSRILDVGCGIGGSARILARDYGFEMLGISISPAQIARARELTPPGPRVLPIRRHGRPCAGAAGWGPRHGVRCGLERGGQSPHARQAALRRRDAASAQTGRLPGGGGLEPA